MYVGYDATEEFGCVECWHPLDTCWGRIDLGKSVCILVGLGFGEFVDLGFRILEERARFWKVRN